MNPLAPVLMFALSAVSGCVDPTTDLQRFMADVKASSRTTPDISPPVIVFEHLPYTSEGLRNPFSLPSSDDISHQPALHQHCILTDLQTEKQALEHFALGQLKMRGTVGHAEQLWALIEASDQRIHRIGLNDRVGLFQGKVVAVRPDYIEITEFIPDDSGCSVQKNSTLQLVNAAAGGTGTN